MIKSRIENLRDILKNYNLDGYIIPANDQYMNQYTAERDRKLEFITGFTGSNGVLVITQTHAFLFTDGRYLQQAKNQLDPNIFIIIDIGKIADHSWKDCIDQDIGYDSRLFSQKFIKLFEKLKLRHLPDDFIDDLWPDRPFPQKKEIYHYPIQYSGEDHSDKVLKCRNIINEYEADALVITSPESICWLLNLRSNEVINVPILLSRLILTSSNTYLFIDDTARIDITARDIISTKDQKIEILEHEQFALILSSVGNRVLIDKDIAPLFVINLCLANNQELVHLNDPCQLFKAVKNLVEITNSIDVHGKDAVAICEFLSSLNDLCNNNVNECELGEILTGYRNKQKDFVMNSFPVICGFNENSAIIHYRAEEASAKMINKDGILLLDSGGHYLGGTTDVTRTIAIGDTIDKVRKNQKNYYTRVLKGHIALATAIFPIGITGANLDVLARQYLWQEGQDYPHGTGHGVSNFLNVHEGPQAINLKNHATLKEGMILSNEPGYYKPNEYGIRIENLQYIKKSDYQDYLCFEVLTLIPYDKNLIDISLLNSEEKKYLKNYYDKIKLSIAKLLTDKAATWLEDQLSLVNDF